MIADVEQHPLYEDVRSTWGSVMQASRTRSVIGLPFQVRGRTAGVFFLRTTHYDTPLNRLDLFSHIGGFSGAGGLGGRAFDPKTDFNGAFADPKAFAKKVRLLWLGIGTAEPERMREGIRGFHKALVDAGIDHVYVESQGTDHEWQTWRRNLHDFAPRLFRAAR